MRSHAVVATSVSTSGISGPLSTVGALLVDMTKAEEARARRKLRRISCDVLRLKVRAMSSGVARVWAAVGEAPKEREARGGLGRKSSKLLLRMVENAGAWRS